MGINIFVVYVGNGGGGGGGGMMLKIGMFRVGGVVKVDDFWLF